MDRSFVWILDNKELYQNAQQLWFINKDVSFEVANELKRVASTKSKAIKINEQKETVENFRSKRKEVGWID